MSHQAIDVQLKLQLDPRRNPVLSRLERVMLVLNRLIVIPCMAALVVAACVLTYSVAARYFLKISTEWQDEAAVFLLIGATFLSGAYVQAYRGHIGIEAVATLLSPRANRWRMLVVDLLSLLFCTFFSWKSWTLLHEAWVDGQTTNSTWGPPLWIPYVLMALGMTLICLQMLCSLTIDLLADKTAAPVEGGEHARWLGD
ncbi:TRAP transporter small permease [Oxalicibacterium sp.]|uniref:TRAP transporter small permease n=1 Tax=Oxalicibacterium sp. TaxID=2766525 RepID=UPI0039C94A92